MSACTAGGHLKFETALFLGRAFGHSDLVTIRVAGEDERQRAVAGDVAGGAEAVLKREDGQHERGARAVKQQDASPAMINRDLLGIIIRRGAKHFVQHRKICRKAL